ncbi:MAG: tRNA epoxyqueuosine(34) reductase QueG [Alphaproteobacteria bacterium]|nr:tRNA epoxyqueuosine(34) reductase QueG [Alphaproteobacteria bacterium]|tara:strand:- start:2973 stop:4109 length:1137 start_codon:yes stop_codon:yes gene_type:complete
MGDDTFQQPPRTEIRQRIREKAQELGFDAVGFAPVHLAPEIRDHLNQFIDEGRHGDMDWMPAKAERRREPAALWPDANSVIALGMVYTPEPGAFDTIGQAAVGHLSVYARGRDYHDVVKKRMKALGRWICDEFPGNVKVFVDTAPVMEKPVAQAAGLGWQGKHTNLVSREHGSWLFLGEVFTTLDLPPDAEQDDHCGSCRRCLDACPTGALPAPYRIDARRCISYLTIEHKGPIDRELRPLIGNRIYGCDDCLAVCPWNKFAKAAPVAELRGREDLSAPDLVMLAGLQDAEFRAFFSRTAIKRLGRDRFVRNVLIALGNVGGAGALNVVQERLTDESPLVRGAAVWALSRLVPAETFAEIRSGLLPGESDADVIAEWS